MCLLIYVPPMFDPDKDRVRNASYTNGDGFGYAIENENRDGFIVYKSMDFDECWSHWEQDRSILKDREALFHLRYTTGGLLDTSNAHPFYIGKHDDGTHRADVVMAHNGILPIDPEKGGRNDTRIFAEDYMPQWVDDMDDEELFNDLDAWVRKCNSKLVFLVTGQAPLKYGVYIAGEADGHWMEDDGCWYSNKSYTYRSQPKWTPQYTSESWKTNPYQGRYSSGWEGGWDTWDTEGDWGSSSEHPSLPSVDNGFEWRWVPEENKYDKFPVLSSTERAWAQYIQARYGDQEPQSEAIESETLTADHFAGEYITCFHCGSRTEVDHCDEDEKYRCLDPQCGACLLCGVEASMPCSCQSFMSSGLSDDDVEDEVLFDG